MKQCPPACALTVLVSFVLSSCGLMTPSYSLYAPEKALPDQFQSDRVACQSYAERYAPPFDVLGLGLAASNGALSEPLSPTTAAIGGAAGLANSALSQLGASPADRRAVFLTCVQKKTDADHSGLVLDPR